MLQLAGTGTGSLPVIRAALLPGVLLLALVLPPAAAGQILYGSLTGTITDQTGGALPGAKIDITNPSTGVVRSVVTDERGNYLVADLQPGTYDITIDLAGFRPVEHKGTVVVSNSRLRLDARLEISAVTDSVAVTASTPQLQTERADLQITQTARQVNDLPLTGSAGRNYQSLMTVVPGALMAGEQNSAAGSPQRSISFNVNGVSRLQNNTKLDGASVVYPWLPTNTAYVPSSEAIEEVSIVTNAYNAEQGMAGGAAINVVIKSGTNSFRATAWGYNTDYDWRARNYFLAADGPQARWSAQSVRRQLRRTDPEEQAVLLRQQRADVARTDRAGPAVQRAQRCAAPR